jgi:hypothetical protein
MADDFGDGVPVVGDHRPQLPSENLHDAKTEKRREFRKKAAESVIANRAAEVGVRGRLIQPATSSWRQPFPSQSSFPAIAFSNSQPRGKCHKLIPAPGQESSGS